MCRNGLESKQVRHLDLRDLPCLETLRPLVAPSLRSGCYSLGPSGFLNTVDPSVSVPNYYVGQGYYTSKCYNRKLRAHYVCTYYIAHLVILLGGGSSETTNIRD